MSSKSQTWGIAYSSREGFGNGQIYKKFMQFVFLFTDHLFADELKNYWSSDMQ